MLTPPHPTHFSYAVAPAGGARGATARGGRDDAAGGSRIELGEARVNLEDLMKKEGDLRRKRLTLTRVGGKGRGDDICTVSVDLKCVAALERIEAELKASRVKLTVHAVDLQEPGNLDERLDALQVRGSPHLPTSLPTPPHTSRYIPTPCPHVSLDLYTSSRNLLPPTLSHPLPPSPTSSRPYLGATWQVGVSLLSLPEVLSKPVDLGKRKGRPPDFPLDGRLSMETYNAAAASDKSRNDRKLRDTRENVQVRPRHSNDPLPSFHPPSSRSHLPSLLPFSSSQPPSPSPLAHISPPL